MDKKPILTYYTDGSSRGNPGPGGYAVIRLSTIYNKNIESYSLAYWYSEQVPNTTNNRMELSAVIHALEIAKEDNQYHYVIYSDSAYVVNMCNDWIWKWACNGWTRAKNKPIENLDLVKKLYDLLKWSEFTWSIKKCDGHAGILENELVDALASDNKLKLDKLMRQYHILS